MTDLLMFCEKKVMDNWKLSLGTWLEFKRASLVVIIKLILPFLDCSSSLITSIPKEITWSHNIIAQCQKRVYFISSIKSFQNEWKDHKICSHTCTHFTNMSCFYYINTIVCIFNQRTECTLGSSKAQLPKWTVQFHFVKEAAESSFVPAHVQYWRWRQQ